MDLLATLQHALAGRYRVERDVGSGGMARVFRAIDERHHRPVALKVLLPELVPYLGVERFEREIAIAARLDHPHILPLLDSGVADGLPYYVMPFVDGQTMRERLDREHQLPLDDAIRIGREISEALSHAHRSGIVHRDIKPDNVMLTDGYARVMDFGVARALGEASDDRLTSTGITIGTPAYMSPEQLLDSHSADERSDQYSLACVIYEMLAGQPPFTGATLEAIVSQHLAVAPRPVTELRGSVPAWINETLLRALAKAPSDRFKDMRTFTNALMIPSRSSAIESATTVPLRTWRGRARSWASVLAVVALLVVVAMTVVLLDRARDLHRFARRDVGPRPWVLVPEFDGPADDPALANGARELVCAALDQSGLVTTLTRDQLAHALVVAGRSDTTRVDATLGRELAYRSSIRTVLEGRVSRVGPRLAVVLRLVDSEGGQAIITESATAETEDRLVATLDRMVRRLRARMGESPNAIAANRDLEEITTPSMEAYRKILDSERLAANDDGAGAMSAIRGALAIDPDCANAYVGLAFLYHNNELPDSALWALGEALDRPSRLSEAARLSLQSLRADTRGDLVDALAWSDRCVVLYPDDPWTLSVRERRTPYLIMAGRDAEGLQSARELVDRSFDKRFASVLLTLSLAQAERFAEADSVLGSQSPVIQARLGSVIAMLAGDRAAARSLETASLASRDPGTRQWAIESRAVFAAQDGAFLEASDDLDDAERSWSGGDPSDPYAYRLLLTGLGLAPLAEIPARDADDPGAHGVIIRAWHAALAGQSREARRLLESLATCTPGQRGHLGAARTYVQAVIDAGEHHWTSVIDSLSDIARAGLDLGYLRWNRIGPTTERWLVADAYEHVGRADSAAAMLERITSHVNLYDRVPALMTRSLAHLRLVQLACELKRRRDAEDHWRAVASLRARADPEVRARIESARLALDRLR